MCIWQKKHSNTNHHSSVKGCHCFQRICCNNGGMNASAAVPHSPNTPVNALTVAREFYHKTSCVRWCISDPSASFALTKKDWLMQLQLPWLFIAPQSRHEQPAAARVLSEGGSARSRGSVQILTEFCRPGELRPLRNFSRHCWQVQRNNPPIHTHTPTCQANHA